MNLGRPARLALFIYESLRLLYVVYEFSAIQPAHPGAFPWITYIAANAFFPIMAFFLWRDYGLYKAYLPMLIAGRCISLFLMIGWTFSFTDEILLEQMMMSAGMVFTPLAAAAILLFGDIFSIICACIIKKQSQKTAVDAGGGE
jgi:hypothetical protein